ncbi:hypothetical protein J6590_073129 [Homalodisca vitripennis]|nr:hypothetical protein J6590_073129 [Homalodisca vitripennis]
MTQHGWTRHLHDGVTQHGWTTSPPCECHGTDPGRKAESISLQWNRKQSDNILTKTVLTKAQDVCDQSQSRIREQVTRTTGGIDLLWLGALGRLQKSIQEVSLRSGKWIITQSARIKQRRVWLLLGWVTVERSCPCKQLACPAVGGGRELTAPTLFLLYLEHECQTSADCSQTKRNKPLQYVSKSVEIGAAPHGRVSGTDRRGWSNDPGWPKAELQRRMSHRDNGSMTHSFTYNTGCELTHCRRVGQRAAAAAENSESEESNEGTFILPQTMENGAILKVAEEETMLRTWQQKHRSLRSHQCRASQSSEVELLTSLCTWVFCVETRHGLITGSVKSTYIPDV